MTSKTSVGFRVINRLVNPMMRRLLLTPGFQGLLGRRLAIVRYRGRRSGRSFELPVLYVRQADTLWIIPAYPNRKVWWKNLSNGDGGVEIQVRLRGVERRGRATVIKQDQHLEEFMTGAKAYVRGLPATRRSLGLQGDPATMSDKEFQAAGEGIVLVRVGLANDD
jgi:hypothetical protein